MNILRIIFNLLRFDRANWKAVGLCVLTAMVFWIFNAFNKNYSTNVRFPILFEFDGEKFTPAQHLPKTINVNVSGNGWDLFRKHLGVKVPQVIIPLERPNEVRKIVGSTLAPILATQVGNLKINFVVTDTVYLQIDKRDMHRYKLAVDVSGVTFRQGYGRISPVVVLPDSVRLDGPESRLHSLSDSILVAAEFRNVSENFRHDVEVNFPGSEFVKRNPPTAQVIFEVGPVQEVGRNLKVTVEKNPGIFAQDSVEAHFQIPVIHVSDFLLQSREISSVVNGKSLRQNKVLLPRVLNMPTYAQLLRVDSVHIKAN